MSGHQEEFETISQSNINLMQDLERCREKESELLAFTQRLTEKNVLLQSEVTKLQETVREVKQLTETYN